MRLKTVYSLPCLCNCEGPRLVNIAVFDPLLLRKFPLNTATSRSQPETRVGYSSRADCKCAQNVQEIDILRSDPKDFGGRTQSKNIILGFSGIRRIWEMRRNECKIGLAQSAGLNLTNEPSVFLYVPKKIPRPP
jgi:hypothetical protein